MSNWTILIIVAVIFYGIIPSFKDRIIPVKKLIMTPAILMYFCYQTISENFHFYMGSDIAIVLGLLAGISVGILLRYGTVIKGDRNQRLIWLPGSYWSLIIFLLIFAVHFLIGYFQSTDPDFLLQSSYASLTILFLITCVSSITVGINGLFYYLYMTCESKTLTMNE